jgi:alginate O-acetyltransferase complex protein AlgI
MLEPWLGRHSRSLGARVVATLIVFHFVCLAWIFFRAEDFAVARLYIAGFGAGWSDGLQQAGPSMVALIGVGLAGQFTSGALFERAAVALGRMPSWGIGAAAGIVVAAINALGPEGVAPFIYFRF